MEHRKAVLLFSRPMSKQLLFDSAKDKSKRVRTPLSIEKLQVAITSSNDAKVKEL